MTQYRVCAEYIPDEGFWSPLSWKLGWRWKWWLEWKRDPTTDWTLYAGHCLSLYGESARSREKAIAAGKAMISIIRQEDEKANRRAAERAASHVCIEEVMPDT